MKVDSRVERAEGEACGGEMWVVAVGAGEIRLLDRW